MTDAPQYRKKPVVISALVWNGLNVHEVQAFAGHGMVKKQEQRLRIKTLEGHIWADPGDYIIRGVNGEFYPCKPDIFAKTYDPADRRAEPVSVQEAIRAEVEKERARYRLLLMKYMDHVGDQEGTAFVTGHWHDQTRFSCEEWAELEEIDAAAIAAIRARGETK